MSITFFIHKRYLRNTQSANDIRDAIFVNTQTFDISTLLHVRD